MVLTKIPVNRLFRSTSLVKERMGDHPLVFWMAVSHKEIAGQAISGDKGEPSHSQPQKSFFKNTEFANLTF